MAQLARTLVCGAVACSLSAISPAAPPRDRGWFEQVERDRDRGAGRVLGDQEWELRRLNESRDVRLRRQRPRREFERLDEERDRQLLIETRAREARPGLLDAGRSGDSVILSHPPAAGGRTMSSPLAAQVSADERALAEAKDRLERSLRGVNVAEQRALRTLRRRLNRAGRADEFERESAGVRGRHERLRAGHRADYDRTRSRILGRP